MQKIIPYSIEKEFVEFEKQYVSIFQNKHRSVDEILHHLITTHGKCLRPMLVLLSAGMSGKINRDTYLIATIIELLHISSLVHDDVIDNASYRRNQPTLNALWNNKISVLTGDYLISKCLQVLCEINDPLLFNYIGDLVNRMSEGELIQLSKINDYSLTEEEYYLIIQAKTADLFGACLYLGAYSSGASQEDLASMECIGKEVGTAFQIQDDLKDYNINLKDKDFAKDIKERIVTLPLIHAMQKMDEAQKQVLMQLYGKEDKSDDIICQIINTVKQQDGLLYAHEIIRQKVKHALLLLEKCKDSIYKESLREIIQQLSPEEHL